MLLVALGLLQVAHAAAQASEAFELAWSAPKGCPGAEEVRARVRKLAGSPQVSGVPLRAEATVARRAEGELHLRLVIHADALTGERNIDGKSCSDLAGATAVALALLLRSTTPLSAEDLTGSTQSRESATGAPTSSTPAARTQAGAAASPVTGSAATPTSAGTGSASMAGAAGSASSSTSASAGSGSAGAPPPQERGWRGLLQVPLLMVGVGPLHRPSYGLAVAAGASVGRWLALAEGRAWLPQRTSADYEGERYHADVQRFAAGLRGGYRFLWPRFQLAPCVSLSAEHMSARGGGPHIAPSQAKTTWIAAGFGVQVRFPVARWLSLVAGVELQIQTSRPQIAIDDVGIIEQLLPVAAGFTLAPEWIL